MSTLLITGASGFVGARLIDVAAAAGCTVRATTRRRPPRAQPSPRRVSWHSLDTGADEMCAELCTGADVVVHCARGPVLPLARAALSAGVGRFVFLSTVDVIASHSRETPLSEADLPSPVTAYARSKWSAELGLRTLFARSATDLVVLRPALVHGPGARGNFGRLVRLVRSGLPLPFARTDNRRSFIGLENLCSAIVCAARSPAAPSGTFHVTDEPPISTLRLVTILADALRVPRRLFALPRWVPTRAWPARKLLGDFVVDGSRFRTATGWSQPVSLEAGLRSAAREHRP